MKFLPGPEALFVLGLLVIIPGVLARFVVGAGWLQVLCAFIAWFFVLWLALGGPSNSGGEQVGWTMIMGMFFSWAGVPIAAAVLRAFDVPYRFI